MNNDLISRSELIKTIDRITWYHINPHGELVEGAHVGSVTLYKAEDIYKTIDNAPTVDIDYMPYREETCENKSHCYDYEHWHCVGCNGCKELQEVASTKPQGERAERALAIIDRLRTDGHINNREQGTLRRAILLPERPQGEWKYKIDGFHSGGFDYCSICNFPTPIYLEKPNFCPKCGADMRGDSE